MAFCSLDVLVKHSFGRLLPVLLGLAAAPAAADETIIGQFDGRDVCGKNAQEHWSDRLEELDSNRPISPSSVSAGLYLTGGAIAFIGSMNLARFSGLAMFSESAGIAVEAVKPEVVDQPRRDMFGMNKYQRLFFDIVIPPIGAAMNAAEWVETTSSRYHSDHLTYLFARQEAVLAKGRLRPGEIIEVFCKSDEPLTEQEKAQVKRRDQAKEDQKAGGQAAAEAAKGMLTRPDGTPMRLHCRQCHIPGGPADDVADHMDSLGASMGDQLFGSLHGRTAPSGERDADGCVAGKPCVKIHPPMEVPASD